MPDFEICAARGEDAAAIAAIYAPYVLNSTATLENTPPGAEEMARRMGEYNGFYPWLACTAQGALLGYAYASRVHARPGYNWSAATSVYLRENARRQGAGRALYTVLLNLLRAQGVRAAYALVTHPHPGSEAFHRRMGFAREGLLRHAGYKFGRPIGVAYYALDLLPPMENPPPPLPIGGLAAAHIKGIMCDF